MRPQYNYNNKKLKDHPVDIKINIRDKMIGGYVTLSIRFFSPLFETTHIGLNIYDGPINSNNKPPVGLYFSSVGVERVRV